MAGKTRTFLVRGPLALLLVLTIVASASSTPRAMDGNGDEWLSWSSDQRTAFVIGYLDGHMRATRKACNAALELFGLGKSQRPGEDPSAPCIAHSESYSKDSESYTTVLTDFYSRNPKYRTIPFIYILWHLNDNQYKTADQLLQMALSGDLRASF